MSTLEQKKELRNKGLTYQEIANELGISKQAVAQSLSKYSPSYFRNVRHETCIYKGLRYWMNENKVTIAEFLRKMGVKPYYRNYQNFVDRMSGRTEFRKKEIDVILAFTGMTYEECFKED